MPRPPASNSVNLKNIFKRVQSQMLAHFACGEVFEHPTICGAATEREWIDLFSLYLPQRYSATPAFVVNADGHRSRQIDITVYDKLYSPPIFPHESGVHVPAESVYAIFEVKTMLTLNLLTDAGEKAASVRALRRTSTPVVSAGAPRPPIRPNHILAGVLALGSHWPTRFQKRLSAGILAMPPAQRLDIGCILRQGAFEYVPHPGRRSEVHFSTKTESLIFFFFRLLDRLRSLGTAPALDLMQYGRSLSSFRKTRYQHRTRTP